MNHLEIYSNGKLEEVAKNKILSYLFWIGCFLNVQNFRCPIKMTEIIEEQKIEKSDTLQKLFGDSNGMTIKQKTDLFELITAFEMSNKYVCQLSNGKTLNALEDSNCFARYYLGSNRW
jgi:hypothetical protein